MALSLKKEVDFLTDALGIESNLYTLRLKGGKEIDFLILRKGKHPILLEAKLSESNPSSQFSSFQKYFSKAHKFQIVRNLSREKTTAGGVEIREALHWLEKMDFSSLP